MPRTPSSPPPRRTEPLRDRCEVVLAAIEALPSAEAQSSVHAMLYSSGLAACHAILVALAPDSDRVLISGGYHGTHQVLDVLRRLKPDLQVSRPCQCWQPCGICCMRVPCIRALRVSRRRMTAPPQVIELPALGAGPAEPAVQARDIVWLETPRNPMCEVYDIEGYAAAAKQAGAKVVVDGTFAPPPLQVRHTAFRCPFTAFHRLSLRFCCSGRSSSGRTLSCTPPPSVSCRQSLAASCASLRLF